MLFVACLWQFKKQDVLISVCAEIILEHAEMIFLASQFLLSIVWKVDSCVCVCVCVRPEFIYTVCVCARPIFIYQD